MYKTDTTYNASSWLFTDEPIKHFNTFHNGKKKIRLENLLRLEMLTKPVLKKIGTKRVRNNRDKQTNKEM